ncbi:MAG: AEC family transporter [Clostridium sp.]|nr:MAG: AEC family transporter [Clostridium sp.]
MLFLFRCFGKTNEKVNFFRIAMMFSNAVYMGFSLINTIYDDLGLIYASGFVTVLNVLLWTIGVLIDSNNISFKESIKQILEVPVLYAVIVGMIIATSNIFSSLKNIYLWLTVIIRLIIIPFYYIRLVWLLKLFNIDKEIIIVIFILNACPSAAITSVFAIKFNHDENIAASCIVVTTLLSIISLPLFTMLINQFF